LFLKIKKSQAQNPKQKLSKLKSMEVNKLLSPITPTPKIDVNIRA